MSSSTRVDKDAVRAAKEFLLGRSSAGGESHGVRVDPAPEPGSSSQAMGVSTPRPTEPAIELSAADIRRTGSGWRARCIHARGVDVRHVNDARHGGYVGSFIAALEARDRFYRERGMAIPWRIEALVDGERIAPEVVARKRSIVVRWRVGCTQ